MAEILTVLHILMIPKSYDLYLTTGLRHTEFKCRCSRKTCTHTLVVDKLRTAYGNLRTSVGFPLEINSGFRCQMHNAEVGGSSSSSHMTGHAIDISTKNLNMDEFEVLLEQSKIHFDVVIIYETFIHCHMEGK